MAGPLRSILARFGFEFDTAGAEKAHAHISHLVEGVEKFGQAFIGGKIVREFGEFVHRTIEEAAVLGETAEKLDIAADKLQIFQEAVQESGGTAESLTAGLRKLAAAANGSEEGGKDAAKVFKDLGVEIKDANGKVRPLEELFIDAGGAIGSMTDNVKRAATAQKIFGRGGLELLGFFKDGKEGAEAMLAELEALGGGFDEATIEGSKKFGDSLKRLQFVLKGFRGEIVLSILPALQFFVDKATVWSSMLVRLFKNTNFLRAIFLALGVVVGNFAATTLAKFWPIIRTFGLFAAKLAIVALIIDDILGFLEGGDSVIGSVINALFGAGAAQATVKELRAIWQDFIENVVPQIGQTFSDLWADIKATGTEFKDWLFNFVHELAGDIWDLLPARVQEVLTIVGAYFSAHIDQWLEALGNFVSAALDKINPFKGLLSGLFGALDEKANDAARAEARAREGTPAQAKAAGVPLKAFRQGAVDTFGGFHPSAVGAAPGAAGQAAANVVRVPAPTGAVVNQTNETTIHVDARGAKDPNKVARQTGAELRGVHRDSRNAALAAVELR